MTTLTAYPLVFGTLIAGMGAADWRIRNDCQAVAAKLHPGGLPFTLAAAQHPDPEIAWRARLAADGMGSLGRERRIRLSPDGLPWGYWRGDE